MNLQYTVYRTPGAEYGFWLEFKWSWEEFVTDACASLADLTRAAKFGTDAMIKFSVAMRRIPLDTAEKIV